MTIPPIRLALGKHLGQVLTPELAYSIECQAAPGAISPVVAVDSAALVTIEQIEALEREMLKGEQIDLPVRDFFSHKCYARELFIPAGTVLIGRVHKFQNLNIMSMGELSVLTDDGIKRIKAPYTVSSPPGTKRVAFAHADTLWTTIHGTELTDVDEIEQAFTTRHYGEYLEFCTRLIKEGA